MNVLRMKVACVLFVAGGLIISAGCGSLTGVWRTGQLISVNESDQNLEGTIDLVRGHYRVTTRDMLVDQVPAEIPLDAIEYGLAEFCGLPRDYVHLEAMAVAAQKGLRMKGYCNIAYVHGKVLGIQLIFHRNNRHLEFAVNTMESILPKVYAIDMSEANVAIHP